MQKLTIGSDIPVRTVMVIGLIITRSQLPGGFHKLNEVVVVVNRGGHGGVVVVPLGTGDFTVTVLVTEVSEELKEHFVLSHLSGDNLGVHVGGVDTLKVSSLNQTTAVVVKFEVGLVDHSLSLGVQGSTDSNEELIEVNMTITVSVEKLHESVGLSSGKNDTNFLETGVEFTRIDLSVSVERVEVSEDSSETSNGLGTSGLELGSEFVEN